MSVPAAFMAAQPNSSLNAPTVAIPSCRTQGCQCLIPSLSGLITASCGVTALANVHRRDAGRDFGTLEFPPPRIPSPARSHASGLSCAQRQARSSASAAPPSGLRFPSSTDPP
jgi:hypothetical protein